MAQYKLVTWEQSAVIEADSVEDALAQVNDHIEISCSLAEDQGECEYCGIYRDSLGNCPAGCGQ